MEEVRGALTQLIHGTAIFLIEGQLHHRTRGLADLWLNGDWGCGPRDQIRAVPVQEITPVESHPSLPSPPQRPKLCKPLHAWHLRGHSQSSASFSNSS